MGRSVGLDFGTTNSALAVVSQDGTVDLATFVADGATIGTFRSILYGDPSERGPDRRPSLFAGHRALERYLRARRLADEGAEETAGPGRGLARGRLIQSIKSHLSSPHFTGTNLWGAMHTIEQLAGAIAGALRVAAEERFGDLGVRVRVGRPVRFVGATRPEHDRLAEERLRSAIQLAGFSDVGFELEPVAAAFRYGRGLAAAERVLIADFGGGTSDFSLVELAPGGAGAGGGAGGPGGRVESRVLGTAGVGIGGDTFDGRIVHHLIAPRLGANATYRTPFGKDLPVPAWLYKSLERWHHLSFLREARTLELLADVARTASEPDAVRALAYVIDQELGFELYRAVERLKHDLSAAPVARFAFHHGPAEVDCDVARADFEHWIAPDLAAIEVAADEVLASAGMSDVAVDRVFMTGGSSLVPAVWRLFERRFGADKMRGGNELTSVAEGLALREAAG